MQKENVPLIRVENLEKRFGGIVALSGYGIEIAAGELVALIGPNGAGKTTVFNLLSGVLPPTSGRIFFRSREITGRRPDQMAALGISRTFQNIRLFNDLTVADNVRIALHMHLGRGLWHTLLHTGAFRLSEREINRRAAECLELLDLREVCREPARNLPYGTQRRVEIARALAAGPQLLLLDEPAAGLNINETDEMIGLIRRIHEAYGLTIFLVEHDMKLVMAICRRIQVLDRGRVLAVGSPEEIRSNPQVIEAYLGKASGGTRA